MEKEAYFTGNWLIWLVMLFLLPIISGCQDNDETPVFQAEGYLIGHHPCVGNATVMTSKGEGKGYLVATIGANPDTIMLFGVPTDMFDVPLEWHSFLPDEPRDRFKMRFSYQKSQENIGSRYHCFGYFPGRILPYLDPEYIVLKAEKIH
ncbi:hypothetical protein SAMN04488057_102416 [Cyclobacterium lianum]|uniref:Uncharacterized protein n=1 Tax=Cyclobacterium lianum TaxID=388280 RepID=A0A1M7KEM4_9BACT|nr:hypothetical protein [Cyclobacterium lianum]SHM63651.1 hypothetical protein SAMN04488057_102416 [Cyclobacterium lianum]